MREGTLLDFKSRVRRVLNENLRLDASKIVKIADEVALQMAPAIDTEVAGIVESCGLIPGEEFGGSVI